MKGVVPGGSKVVPGEVVPGSPVFQRKTVGNVEPGTPSVERNQVRNHVAGTTQDADDRSLRTGIAPLRSDAQQPGNVRGNTRDPLRGSYCTPKWLADALGPFDLDPFSNLRSHIHAAASCALEMGGDGFGDGMPGSYRTRGDAALRRAGEVSRVFLQPDYQFVLRAFRHYAHTRWVALLRFDPRPEWFDYVYEAAELVAVIRHDPEGRPFGFDAPPGVRTSTNSFPHALYARFADDVPRQALRCAAAWRKSPT